MIGGKVQKHVNLEEKKKLTENPGAWNLDKISESKRPITPRGGKKFSFTAAKEPFDKKKVVSIVSSSQSIMVTVKLFIDLTGRFPSIVKTKLQCNSCISDIVGFRSLKIGHNPSFSASSLASGRIWMLLFCAREQSGVLCVGSRISWSVSLITRD